jgi:SAM-dependent methyltransferase
METPKFKDHFSGHASDYAQFRPVYPRALFEYLAGLTPGSEQAWDCATGSGQAAQVLTEYFKQVIATDASAQQIENAAPHPAIDYRVESAESTSITDHSVDLITVAQALHWFDFDAFFSECQRVLKPGGILAVIAYSFLNIQTDIDDLLADFYHEVIGPYWPPERRHIDEAYASIPFPFETIKPPLFEMSRSWSLQELGGYLSTWSATQRYMHDQGNNPVTPLLQQLETLWGSPETTKTVSWPLMLKIGRFSVPSEN